MKPFSLCRLGDLLFNILATAQDIEATYLLPRTHCLLADEMPELAWLVPAYEN